ncbi:MAG: lipase family protein [Bryobacteraceae bacterium]
MNFDPVEAARNAEFVKFAYNMYGNGGVLLPPPDPGIDAAGFQLVAYLTAQDFDDVKFYGYLAASKARPDTLVLAIRGTQNFAEWLLDIAILPVPFTPFPDAGFVALGIQGIADSFKIVGKDGASSSLTDAIAAIGKGTGIQSLSVIGHSLGGALATLAAANLAMANTAGVQNNLTVYTFGSPRVGLLDFAASYNKAVKTSFRVWNELDVVPEVPVFPYIHVSGLGDKIVQTEHQLSTLAITPQCEHHLTSYLWLLDSTKFQLDANCNNEVPQIGMAPNALNVMVPPDHVSGAQALRKAASGRL